MPRRYRRRGAATFVYEARDRVDPAEVEQRLAERVRRLTVDDRTEAEMAQRSAGRSLGTSCQTLGRVLIKMGLVSNGWSMSALPPKADMRGATRHVRFGPKADIGYAIRSPRPR